MQSTFCSMARFRRDSESEPRVRAASWSSVWYMLSAFAVISYTRNPLYTLFAAGGSWLGAFCAVTWLSRGDSLPRSSKRP